ncbi:hypothetical protein MNBD_GAMMA26-534 [hydrothermal vent metagenome]|uniref:Uncharacterized protein n=1 Tax=hydrothermal vent metagenome TaxID=652676 RepID=A0A3B1AQR5_9ZZZZ
MPTQVKGLQTILLWSLCCTLAFAAPPAPKAGLFLVATKKMSGPIFSRTVILLVKADKTGTMGVIINRPTPHSLGDVVQQLRGTNGADSIIFDGGPVAPIILHTLYRSKPPVDSSIQVFEGVYFSNSEQVLLDRIQTSPTSTRIYSGYTGWAAGQLESELKRGDWHLVAADPEVVFRSKTDGIWQELVPAGATRWVRKQQDFPSSTFNLL